LVGGQVYQTAFALVGHVLANETGPTEPPVDRFLDAISANLDTPNTARRTRGNALWALVHAVCNRSVSDDRLAGFVDRLIAIFKQVKLEFHGSGFVVAFS